MRPIYEIAEEIRADWKPVSPYAKPYLDAMFSLNDISDDYFADSGKSVVLYFLSNAGTWRGETALYFDWQSCGVENVNNRKNYVCRIKDEVVKLLCEFQF